MRTTINMNDGWEFTGPQGDTTTVNVPHTWNAEDGQDGGNDYWRGTCVYRRTFVTPHFDADQRVYLEFQGVNATADVEVNGTAVAHHDGGYSTFRADITDQLVDGPGESNTLTVHVDNSINDHVYPQKADFTFYGGIYRPVSLLIVNASHFDLDHFGSPGFSVTTDIADESAEVSVSCWVDHVFKGITVKAAINAADGTQVALFNCEIYKLNGQRSVVMFFGRTVLDHPHLWDGVNDPYLYTIILQIQTADGTVVDEVKGRFGVRSFSIDPDKGFFLNGRAYPLRGVSRHQDRKGIGNALTDDMHREDMAIIRDLGANTIRLAHYQHSQTFYDLCDEAGMVVWAEIPYISEHMPAGRDNTISQMTELITQNINHPSICMWGLSNEITISTKNKADMLDNHRVLNDLVHNMDPTRPTTLACYAMCGPFNKSAFVSDVVAWNLYLGWYVPGLFLNKLWFGFWRLVHPKRAIGMSEYGCEAMPNLHSSHPRREDHSEEYQCIYHEYMLRFFATRPYFWATHVWNMFDFAADARDQGGEPGMNHKGLVTFDRTIRKDAFYAYKAFWSKEPFVHVCGSRYNQRAEKITLVKVYSNQPTVELLVDGKPLATKKGDKVFSFYVPLGAPGETTVVEARSGDLSEHIAITRVARPNPAYKLGKKKQKNNWA